MSTTTHVLVACALAVAVFAVRVGRVKLAQLKHQLELETCKRDWRGRPVALRPDVDGSALETLVPTAVENIG